MRRSRTSIENAARWPQLFLCPIQQKEEGSLYLTEGDYNDCVFSSSKLEHTEMVSMMVILLLVFNPPTKNTQMNGCISGDFRFSKA